MLLAKNRKALYNYEVLARFIAGIVLRGYEVKSIRESNANLAGAYIQIIEGEVYVTGMHVGKYSKLSQEIPDKELDRPRKLLLNKHEINQIKRHLSEKGKTAVPLALLLRNNLIKLELATVKGKKKHEKKIVEKERQIRKDLEKQIKSNKRSVF